MALPAATTPIVITTAPAVAAPVAPAVSGFVTVWGVTVNPMAGVLILLIAVVIYMLWRAQRDQGKNSFDFWDMVMDTLPDGSRRASAIKMFFLGSFLLSSWVVVDQEIKSSQMLPSIFGIYMMTWGASLIAKVIFDQKAMPDFKLPGTREA